MQSIRLMQLQFDQRLETGLFVMFGRVGRMHCFSGQTAARHAVITQRGDLAGLLWLQFASCERVLPRKSLPARARATGNISSASIPLLAERSRKRVAQRCDRLPTRELLDEHLFGNSRNQPAQAVTP